MKIGFDLWGTLIKPNPLFRERRLDLIEKHIPYQNAKLISEELDIIKTDLNRIIEYSGWQPPKETILNMIEGRLGISYEKAEEFMEDYQRLALIYSPELYDSNTFKYIKELASLHDLHIVSNTMLLNGETLNKILDRMKIRGFFKTASFSDQMDFSKPSIKIHNIKFDYFIGDSTVTDQVYAEKLNSEFILINKNNKTIKDVYNIITKTIG